MKKLLIGLVLLGSIVFAKPMPIDSPQETAVRTIREEIALGLEPVTCPSERDSPNIQVACAVWTGPPMSLEFLRQLDSGVAIQNDLANDGAATPLPLIEQTDSWLYRSGTGRFERSYALGNGTFRVIFALSETSGGEVTMQFIP
jgi:hypothetical protein